MPRKIIAHVENVDDGVDVAGLLAQYKTLDEGEKQLAERKKQVRDTLSAYIEEVGEEDDKGHLVYDLGGSVAGYKQLVRQRRVKRQIDEHVAERLLGQKGLKDLCYRLVPVLDEDAVMKCLFEGLLTEGDIDAMFPTTITWAFVPLKG